MPVRHDNPAGEAGPQDPETVLRELRAAIASRVAEVEAEAEIAVQVGQITLPPAEEAPTVMIASPVPVAPPAEAVAPLLTSVPAPPAVVAAMPPSPPVPPAAIVLPPPAPAPAPPAAVAAMPSPPAPSVLIPLPSAPPVPEPVIDWAALASAPRPAPPVIQPAGIAALDMPKPAVAAPPALDFSLLDSINLIPIPGPSPMPSGTLGRLRSQIAATAELPAPGPAFQAGPAAPFIPSLGIPAGGTVPASAVTVSLGEVMRLIAAGSPPSASF
jgi:hypothetical protein